MAIVVPIGTWPLPRVSNDDGTIQHVICEESREHVIYWDSHGPHCIEPNCEINQGGLTINRFRQGGE